MGKYDESNVLCRNYVIQQKKKSCTHVVAWRPHNSSNQRNSLVLYLNYHPGGIKRGDSGLRGS